MDFKIKPLPVILGLSLAGLVIVKTKTVFTPLATRLVSADDNVRNEALAELPKLQGSWKSPNQPCRN